MKFETRIEAEEKARSRALVPLTVTTEDRTRGYSLANAGFVTQLTANKKGFSLYRAKRREQPEIGAKNYRTTIAAALAYRPNGKKLNYCA